MRPAAIAPLNRPEQNTHLLQDTQLPENTLESCDGCGSHVKARWLVFTIAGQLTFCGEHMRRFARFRQHQ